jgi:hypothetical protein
MVTDVSIRAFRATDDRDTCIKYIQGHKKILENHGIFNVSSSNEEWMHLDSVYVIAVESPDRSKLYGGARLHVANGKNKLPIEEAVYDLDSKISDVVKYYSQSGLAELGGVWNSKEVAGYGVGSFMPALVAVVLLEQLDLPVLMSLCSPMTVRFKEWIGAVELISIGNKGTFYYPKVDLLATALYCDDSINMPITYPRQKQKIKFLRQHLQHEELEKTPFKNEMIKVHYDLKLTDVNTKQYKIPLNE